MSKSGHTSIWRPPGSTTASPQLGSCCFGELLATNSTCIRRPTEEINLRLLFQRRFFRWQSSVLSSNLDSGKTRSAAYRCSQTRPPTAGLPHGYVAWALTILFLRSSGHSTQTPPVEQVCWSDAYGGVGRAETSFSFALVPHFRFKRRIHSPA